MNNLSNGERDRKGKIRIDGSRMEALADTLEIVIRENQYDRAGKTLKAKRDDRANFTLYLNYAVANIQEVAGIAGSDLRRGLNSLKEEQAGKLADFLWTFRFNEPGFDFRKKVDGRDYDYRRLAPKLAQKIVDLRDYFVHDDRNGNEPLVCDRELYVLLEGLLRSKAEEAAAGPGTKIDKLIKGHFLNLRERVERVEDQQYDLTRKGIMFLVCLALYKDDAEEFLSGFADMRIPNRRRDALDDLTPGKAKELFGGPKVPSKRAFLDAFTYFSYRRGRMSVNTEENWDYLNFANIIGYLCKVPKASFEYLALDEERKLLADLAAKSPESDENKLFKYDLSKQIRAKERFVSLAAGWLEDHFECLNVPLCIHFKRLDTTESVERHRFLFGYLFGAENDTSVRMGRHYIVANGAIRFEWRAKTHYKPDGIKIGCLRSAIGAQEFRHLLYCVLRNAKGVNAALDAYFSAYHRLLEIMLNSSVEELNVFANPELAQSVQAITGREVASLFDEDGLVTLSKFFPRNIWRYFVQIDKKPTDEEKADALYGTGNGVGAVGSEMAKCDDFLTRVRKFRAWYEVNAKKAIEARARKPRCAKGELLNPPRECQITNAAAVDRVMAYLNFFLSAKRKFRQLQLGEQHNSGLRDHEYQLVRRAISKFSYDNDSVLCQWKRERKYLTSGRENPRWHALSCKVTGGNPLFRAGNAPDVIECWNGGLILKLRDELREPLDELCRALQEQARRRLIEKFRGNYDLNDLAAIAADLLRRKLDAIPMDQVDDELCRKFGVRVGLPLDHDALVRSILGIDQKEWSHAFDYQSGRNYEDRRLEDGEHIVSQVPFPNGFADRYVRENARMFSEAFSNKVSETDIPWSAMFARLDDGKMKLLNFYDVVPLVQYVRTHRDKAARLREDPDAAAVGINAWEGLDPKKYPPDFSRGGVNKAIAAIKTAHNEDRLLLKFAFWYWERYQKSESFDPDNAKIAKAIEGGEIPSVRNLYEVKRSIDFAGMKMIVSRNDVFSPTFAHVRDNAKELVRLLKVEMPEAKEVLFSSVAQFYARQQRIGRQLRSEMIPLICDFDAKCPIPQSAYKDGSGQTLKEPAIREMEYGRYAKVFTWLTREEYDMLADVRNRIMHDGLLIVEGEALDKARRILRRAQNDFTPLPRPNLSMGIKISVN